MATEPVEQADPTPNDVLRPPVVGGTGHVESLGRWIDDLMGHSKIQRQVQQEIADLMSAVNNGSDERPPQSPAPQPDPPKTRPLSRYPAELEQKKRVASLKKLDHSGPIHHRSAECGLLLAGQAPRPSPLGPRPSALGPRGTGRKLRLGG